VTTGDPGRWGAILEQSASAFLAGHLADPPVDKRAELAGTVVGNYRLLQEIGRGGMGTVWLAERADGHFEQRVAIKLMKRGMDSDEILARFRRERQILARLDHPNIARLMDGGIAADGMPYFVMEYIDGERITDWCDARQLSISDRLQLFVETCGAVQYAHRSLVVHRDIKPSNVLVTEGGVVKLMDFGVAKLLESEEETTATRGPMTREYASPEQLTGAPITTATDVYQLGVLLYELLTGHRPWSRALSSPDFAITGGEVRIRKPSTSSRTGDSGLWSTGERSIEPDEDCVNRGTTKLRLKKRLRGDLDSIVLKALRSNPEERYPSPEALADDIERHLTQRPVMARDAGFADRVYRFVRRHRFRVAAGAVVAFAFLGGSLFYAQRIREERDAAVLEAAKAVQNAELVRQVFGAWSPEAANRGEVTASAILENAVRRTETELRDRPEMLAASLSTLGELFANIGRTATADSLLARARDMQQTHAPSSADLAATLARQGRLFATAGAERAIVTLERAVAMHRTLFGARRIETLRVQRDLAVGLRAYGQHGEAEKVLGDVLELLTEADRQSAFALEVASELGYVYFLQARYEEARAVLTRTLDQQRQMLGAQNVTVLHTMRYLASTLRDRGALDEAERLYREALRIARNLYGDDHLQTAFGFGVLAILLERKGQLEEAERLTREELAVIDGRGAIAWLEHIRLGAIRLDRGDPVEAERLLRLGLDSLRSRYPSGNPDEADALNRLAYITTERGAPDADRWYRQAVSFDRARKPGSPVFVSDGLHFLGWAHFRRDSLADAESVFQRALQMYRVQLPADHAYTFATMEGLRQLLARRNGSGSLSR